MCEIKVEVVQKNRKPVLTVDIAADANRNGGCDWFINFTDGSKVRGEVDGRGGEAVSLKFSPPDAVRSVRVRTFVGNSVHEHLYRIEGGEVLPSREIGCPNN